MSQNTFEVVFKGKLVEGAEADQVKARVAALFKVDVSKVERLFSGATVSIKKGVDEQTAKKYQLALQKAGAITTVVNRAAAEVEAPKPVPQPSTPPAEPGKRASFAVDEPQAVTGRAQFGSPDESSPQVVAPASPASSKGEEGPQATPPPAQFGSAEDAPAPRQAVETMPSVEGLHKSVVKEAPQGVGEWGDANVDAPGTVLVEHQEVPEPQIDTSQLSVDQVGAELSQHEEVPPPQVDISGFTLDEEGEALGEEEPFEELQVDTGAMSMDEPGVTLVEHEDVPEPQIDTSKLSMD